jgi:diacylglycerol kinase (ATP)
MRIYRATLNTFRGLTSAARSEAALRQEIAVLAVAIPLGFLLAPSIAWYVAMIGVLWVVMAVELLNTAIEKLADHVTPEWHSQIGMFISSDRGRAIRSRSALVRRLRRPEPAATVNVHLLELTLPSMRCGGAATIAV